MSAANHSAAVAFLQAMHPHDLWLVNAFAVNRSESEKFKPMAATFQVGEEDGLTKFLKSAQGGSYNVYFSVNPPVGRMSKKADRTDIERMAFLQVDLDPRAGEDPEEERKRLLALLTVNLPAGVPKPTAVVDSGGGYWGFWRLEDPFPIERSDTRYEEAKLYNLQLELLFGADSCHNVDRVARLPGTINYPDKRKQGKGRVARLSEVVELNDVSYPLSDFTKAPQVEAPKGGFSSGKTVEISENVQRVEDLDRELPPSVPGWCKCVIAQGKDLDDPTRFAKPGTTDVDRSDALFYVVCELVRNNVTDDMIYAIITDPDWAISSSVIDGSNGRGDRYARRQIERAHEFAVDPQLAKLNERFAVVGSYGGKCRVLSWESQPMPEGESRDILTFQSFADFKNRYSNQFVEIPTTNGVRQIPLGKWWLEHKMRRTYAGIVFNPLMDGDVYKPGYEGDPEYLDHNLWRGFGVQAVAGETPLFRKLVDDVIAGGDEAVSTYVWNWLAWAVQNRDRPAEVAIVLRGGQGTGKGTFARTVGRMFGQHFVHVSDSRAVAGRFNTHMRDCVLLFADEAFLASDRDLVGTLKRTITEPTLRIEGKGENSSEWPNRLHVIMASNESWVVPAEADERRFVVLDVGGKRTDDHAWWAALNAEINNGGMEALLHTLIETDLGNWHPRRDRPMTTALRDQIEESMPAFDQWISELLEEGVLPQPFRDKRSGEVQPDRAWLAETEHGFRDGLLESARAFHSDLRWMSSKALGKLLKGFGADYAEKGGGKRSVRFPPLPELRKTWVDKYGPREWPGGEGCQWAAPPESPF